MVPSDTDLETRLRNLRAGADDLAPVPHDLAATVRARHRRQRRTRLRLAATGLALALVFLAVPVIASSLDARRSDTSNPAAPAPHRSTSRILDEQPTRGSLAGDDEWLAGITELELKPQDPTVVPATGPLPESSIERRAVAFAGDVPDERVALVMAHLTDGRVIQAWFTGPVGAEPEDMVMTLLLDDAERFGELSLLDRPDPGSSRFVLVVVAFPGDDVDVSTSRSVDPTGGIQRRWERLDTEDGAGARVIDLPSLWLPEVRVTGGVDVLFTPRISERVPAVGEDDLGAFDVADPRGLRGTVDAAVLGFMTYGLAVTFGLQPDETALTLLVGGHVAGLPQNTVMLGATLPSGGTVAGAMTYPDIPSGPGSAPGVLSAIAPAGTGLLDRVLVLPLADRVVVSGPLLGAAAELLGPDGELLGTVPLVDGAGAAPRPPVAPASVRILDGSGALVTSAEVPEPGW
jgi:hypothetical protein